MEFYIFYLILILILTGLTVIYYISLKKKYDLSVLKQPIIALLIISFTIFILDSVSYLFVDIDDVAIINIAFSNLFLFLLGFSTIMLGFSLLDEKEHYKKPKE